MCGSVGGLVGGEWGVVMSRTAGSIYVAVWHQQALGSVSAAGGWRMADGQSESAAQHRVVCIQSLRSVCRSAAGTSFIYNAHFFFSSSLRSL